ncbi:helix-turn-helix transcriptional regulator [Nesterenkonia massiliensis]|uniref:Helix-turn-helix transcriptional regulator n=1 Tax=Nesterenkonia massiliensis TaxID=1232429 RepID=A0ABT2HS87_9MICC|nr:helix-turn-helix transcriptional regulator [Nesterenkonia massiliensis]MCT1607370.1 helix-turn-helix transcriptional regulator [Nesterenkonia massiliensis]
MILREELGHSPTAALTDFMLRAAGSTPHEVRRLAVAGRAEGWIVPRDGRSAVVRCPAWMDRSAAADFCRSLEADLGPAAVGLLYLVAVRERIPLRELLDDEAIRSVVFWLLEAGLLRSEGTEVCLGRARFRHHLVLAARDDHLQQLPTASWALARRAGGDHIDDETTVAAAYQHIERGLLEQARFLASGLTPENANLRYIEASILAASGAPRSALNVLETTTGSQPGQPDEHALAAFIRGSLLGAGSAGDTEVSDFSSRLAHFDDYAPTGYLRAFAPPRHRKSDPCVSTERHEVSGKLDLELLGRVASAALDSYAAAIAGDTSRALSSLREVTSVPASKVPLLGGSWIYERVGLARILINPADTPLPESWMKDESPERRLLHAVIDQTLKVVRGVVCGKETPELQAEMDDLWTQFETGLPVGSISRRLLEALDRVLDNTRSVELLGPPDLVPPVLARTFRDACTDTLVLLGGLLHAPTTSLALSIEGAFKIAPDAPGMRRMVLRTVLLRRAASIPADTLQELIDLARAADVEDEVLQSAQVLAWGGENRRRFLASTMTTGQGFRFCTAILRPEHRAAAKLHPAVEELLSAREREITQQLMVGAETADVAHELKISVRTVQAHVRSIYRKLGVASRTQLRARILGSSRSLT